MNDKKKVKLNTPSEYTYYLLLSKRSDFNEEIREKNLVVLEFFSFLFFSLFILFIYFFLVSVNTVKFICNKYFASSTESFHARYHC